MKLEQGFSEFPGIHCKRKILEELAIIYKAKNTDYGNAATQTFEEYGVISYVTRMRDKVERYKRISNNPAMVDEDIEEVLNDLCNYAIMCKADLFKTDYELVSMDISSKMPSRLLLPTTSDFMYQGFIEYLSTIAKTGDDPKNLKWSEHALKQIINYSLQLLCNIQEEKYEY